MSVYFTHFVQCTPVHDDSIFSRPRNNYAHYACTLKYNDERDSQLNMIFYTSNILYRGETPHFYHVLHSLLCIHVDVYVMVDGANLVRREEEEVAHFQECFSHTVVFHTSK